MNASKIFAILFLLNFFTALSHGLAGDGSGLRKVRAAVTSISASMAPAWAAHESGIFGKYGLQLESSGFIGSLYR